MTVINNPPAQDGNNGFGFLLGVVLLIGFALFIMYYGLPMIRNTTAPQINVPSQIDVNIDQKK